MLLDLVPLMAKIIEHELISSNYLECSQTIQIYLWSIDKGDHLSNDPLNDDTKQLAEGQCPFILTASEFDPQ